MVDVAHAPAGQFNPLDTARRLKAARCNPDVAEAVAGELVIALSGLTTKADLDALEERIDTRFDAKLSSAVNRMVLTQLVIAGLLFTALQFAERITS